MDYNKKRNLALIIILVVVILIGIGGFFVFKKLNSYEYKLKKLGYNESQISTIVKNDHFGKEEVLKMEYNEKLPNLLKEKYFLKKNYKKYLDYIDMKPKINGSSEVLLKDIIAVVNVGADNKFYSTEKDTDISKDTLLIVNKFYKLSNDYEAPDVINMGLQYAFNNNSIRSDVYNAFKEMVNEAKAEGLTILANSSYRKYDHQEKVYNNYKMSRGESGADLIAARPGHSEHQTGLAIDISTLTSNQATFETTPEFQWLTQNAHLYGFIIRYPKDKQYLTGFQYESWHYRYVGIDIATRIKELDITFDEYYAFFVER